MPGQVNWIGRCPIKCWMMMMHLIVWWCEIGVNLDHQELVAECMLSLHMAAYA